METMQVEVLEETLKSKDREWEAHYGAPKHHVLSKGDRITVSRPCGERWCDAGWVKDMAEKDPYPTAERKPGARTLQVQSSKHTATKKGG